MKNIVEIKKDGVYLNHEKFFLVSGDFHYFRTVPEGWRRRLELMKDLNKRQPMNMVIVFLEVQYIKRRK